MQKLIEFLESEIERTPRGRVRNVEARDALNEAHELQALLRKCARLLSDGLVRDEVLAKLGDKDTCHVG